MLDDIVVDTNVWAHADNPTELRQADAIELLTDLAAADTKICVDEGFSLVESENRSKIGSEYLAHLSGLPLASALIATLASSGRVAMVTTSVSDPVRRTINRLIRDPSDRVFAKVAHNASSGVLCSHDFAHYPPRVRKSLLTVQVRVLSAAQSAPLL